MQKVYSVAQINQYIKNMFAQDFLLNRVSVRGEVSNCKYHRSGHIYFSLKDVSGTIACVMFARARMGLAFQLSDGQQVVVDGSVSVYERDGKYQLYASRIRQDGAGVLYERFLALKQSLEEMGMFAPEYKKPIPKYVRKLGVVTASTGAAVRDIITVSRRRNPGIQIILYPAQVQGEGAAESVAEGLRVLDGQNVDVIIVGRGGGSIEDLWAFNEEIVARAIFACETPVISAVGHETDTTIADFVADLRAPTPSAAAELAVADVGALWQQLLDAQAGFGRLLRQRVGEQRGRAESLRLRLHYASPKQKARDQRQRAAELDTQLRRGIQDSLQDRKRRMALAIERLRGLSPLEKLAQGYACVTDEDGKRISSVRQVRKDGWLRTYVADGRIESRVVAVEKLDLSDETVRNETEERKE